MLLCFGFAMQTEAQSKLTVKMKDGSEQLYLISEAGKLYFSGSNLQIDQGSGNPASIQTSLIQKLLVEEYVLANPVYTQKEAVYVYPNPSHESLWVANVGAAKMNVRIFSLNGQLLQQGEYSADEAIDVSRLARGFYIISINNTKVIKFSKF